MLIDFHPHAKQRMQERGATEEEVAETLLKGEHFPARFNRKAFRKNFTFSSQWQGRYYHTKQIEAFAVLEGKTWLVITVIVRYF